MTERSDPSPPGRKVLLNGRLVAVDSVARDLQDSQPELVAEVVRQVLADRAQCRLRSEAFVLICTAFRPRIAIFLRSEFFPHDASAVDEVWNDTLERAYYRIERY